MPLPILNSIMQMLPQGSAGGAQALPTMLAQLFPDMMALNKSGQPLTGDMLQSMLNNADDSQQDDGDGKNNQSAYDLLAALLQTAQLLPPASLPVTDGTDGAAAPVDAVTAEPLLATVPVVPETQPDSEAELPAPPVLPAFPVPASAETSFVDLMAETGIVIPAPLVAPSPPIQTDTPALSAVPTEPVAAAPADPVIVPQPVVEAVVLPEMAPVVEEHAAAPVVITEPAKPPVTTEVAIANVLASEAPPAEADAETSSQEHKKSDQAKTSAVPQALQAALKPEAQTEGVPVEKADKPQNAAPVKNDAPVISDVSASRPRENVLSVDAVMRQSAAGNSDQNDSQQSGGQEKQHSGSSVLSQLQSQTLNEAIKHHQNDNSFSKLLHAKENTPVAEQVYVQIRHAAQEGMSRITIQLDPPEMGKVEIRMEVGIDGKTGIVVTAENKDALDLLQRESRTLERALSDAGLKTDSGSMNFNLRQQQQQQQNAQHFWGYQSNGFGAMEDETTGPVITEKYVLSTTSSGLDIKV